MIPSNKPRDYNRGINNALCMFICVLVLSCDKHLCKRLCLSVCLSARPIGERFIADHHDTFTLLETPTVCNPQTRVLVWQITRPWRPLLSKKMIYWHHLMLYSSDLPDMRQSFRFWLRYGMLISLILATLWQVKFGISVHFPGNDWDKRLKLGMLVYPDHIQNWIGFGRGISFFFILAAFWL